MPTYSYVCTNCKHEYEAFQSMKDEPHTKCPECEGKVERLIGSGAGILFKGNGFYVNDYRSASSSNSASTSSDSSEKKSSGTASSSSSSKS